MDGKYQLLRECKAHTDFESVNLRGCLGVDSSSVSHRERTRITISIRTALLWLSHAVLILTSTTFFILGFKKQQCPCSTIPSSILGEGWDTRTFARRFNGTFKLPSTYKGPPSEAVDEAWEKITPMHLIRITESEFQSINASKYAASISDEKGGRIAIFEAFHMIHCLKSLWQNTYPEYYSEMYAYNQEHQEEWHEHVDHCTDMIRQKLMCDADASLITYNWLKNHYYPHPNFNVEHQCRDYDKLLEVAEKRKVDRTFLRPEGKIIVEFEEAPFDSEADS